MADNYQNFDGKIKIIKTFELEDLWDNACEVQYIDIVESTVGITTHFSFNTDGSGGKAYLKLDDGIYVVEVQKFKKQINLCAVQQNGTWVGQNVLVGQTANINVNNVLIGSGYLTMTNGISGQLNTVPLEIEDSETVQNLIVNETVTFNISAEKQLSDELVRVLNLSSRYILGDGTGTIYYKIEQLGDYTTARVPISHLTSDFLGPKVDLYQADVKTYNYKTDTKEWVYAETDNTWLIQKYLEAGTYKYKFYVDGTEVADPVNSNTGIDAAGTYSIVTVESPGIQEFSYYGTADSVSLIGTFNYWNPVTDKMVVGFDDRDVRKMFSPNTDYKYSNNNEDWHKVVITLEQASTVGIIRFRTGVSSEDLQRVRILLDDQPITRLEWEAVSEDTTRNNSTMWENNTDIYISDTDGWFEWKAKGNFDREFSTITIMTRLENWFQHLRVHEGFEIQGIRRSVRLVSDYVFPQFDEIERYRQTIADGEGEWVIPEVVLNEGSNQLLPTAEKGGDSIDGDSIDVTSTNMKSMIERINQSDVTRDNVNVTYTVAKELQNSFEEILDVVDVGDLSLDYTLDDQNSRVLVQIQSRTYDGELFGRIIEIFVSDGLCYVDIEKTFDIDSNDLTVIDDEYYNVVGGRFYYPLYNGWAEILDIEERIGPRQLHYYRLQLDTDISGLFIPGMGFDIEDTSMYGAYGYGMYSSENLALALQPYGYSYGGVETGAYGPQDPLFGYYMQLSNKTEYVTDYCIYDDGTVECWNESGLATGDIDVKYRRITTSRTYPDSQFQEISGLTVGDRVVIIVEPISNRILFSEFEELSIRFFNGTTGLAPDSVRFVINDSFTHVDEIFEIVEGYGVGSEEGYGYGYGYGYNPTVGNIRGQTVEFKVTYSDLFGSTIYSGDHDAVTNPSVNRIQIMFDAATETMLVDEISMIGTSIPINSDCRITINKQEVYRSSSKLASHPSKYEILVEQDSFTVYYNDLRVHDNDTQLSEFNLVLGATGRESGDRIECRIFDTGVHQYLDESTSSLNLTGRWISVETTLKDRAS